MSRLFSNGPLKDFVINPYGQMVQDSTRLWIAAPYSEWIGCPALAPGDFIRPPVHPRDVLDGSGVEVEFSSLSDTRYRSLKYMECNLTSGGLMIIASKASWKLVNR
jgi:hypothetical protein